MAASAKATAQLAILYPREEENTIDNKPRRKTHTSSAVKAKYNAKTYDRIQLNVRKDKAAAYKAKCDLLGIPYSEPLHKAIDALLNQE